jgi:hypothetical protein
MRAARSRFDWWLVFEAMVGVLGGMSAIDTMAALTQRRGACGRCGRAIAIGTGVCPHCGTELSWRAIPKTRAA